MTPKTDKSNTDKVSDAALYWLTVHQTGPLSETEASEFERWLAADPAHAAAYEKTRGAWRDLGQSDALHAMASDLEKEQNHGVGAFAHAVVGRWHAPVAASIAALALLLIAPALINRTPSVEIYATNTAQTETLGLPDGSSIDLAPESEVSIAFSRAVRRVELIAGEAFFDVSKTDPRVFIVAAGETEIVVVGTQFNVRRTLNAVAVDVAEGEVSVRHGAGSMPAAPNDPHRETTLVAGESVIANRAMTSADIVRGAPDRAGAWRTGYLFYRDAALVDVIADLNRYSSVPIVIDDAGLGDLRLAGAFPTSPHRRHARRR